MHFPHARMKINPDWEIIEHNGYCEDRNRDEFHWKALLGTEEWENARQIADATSARWVIYLVGARGEFTVYL